MPAERVSWKDRPQEYKKIVWALKDALKAKLGVEAVFDAVSLGLKWGLEEERPKREEDPPREESPF